MSSEPAVIPRKKPRQARARATCDAILEAAARILQRNGIAAVTTNAVAELAGVSIGSLYQYFPGKEAILAELVRDLRARMLSDLTDAVALCEGRPLREAVHLLLAASVAHQRADPGRAAAIEAVETQLPLDAETAALNRQIAGLVVEVLATHRIPAPEVAARDLAAMTRALTDAAWQAGEEDQDAILARLERAASGYLGLGPA